MLRVGATAIRLLLQRQAQRLAEARHQIVREAVAVLHQQRQQRLQHELHRLRSTTSSSPASHRKLPWMGGRLLLGSEHRRDDGARLLGVARVVTSPPSLPPAWRSRACASHSDTAGR